MKLNLTIKRKCPVCKKKIKNYNDHLELNHKNFYIGKRIKLLGRIEKLFKFMPYIVFIIIVLSNFFFDLILDLFIFLIIISFFIVLYKKRKAIIKESLFSIIDEYKSLKKEVSEEKKKSETIEIKPTLDDVMGKLFSVFNNSYSEEIIVKRIKDIFKNEKYKELNLINGVEVRFKKHLIIVLETLERFLDIEELELINFLKSKREYHYYFWIILQALVIISAIIISILTNIIEGEFYLIYIILLIMTFFNDIQDRVNKTFNKGQYRYIKNKKFLKEYEGFLRLVFYNSHFRKFNEFSNYNKNHHLFKERSDNYRKIINPYMDYIKRFEFIAILGIVISYFYPLFQLSVMINFIFVHWLDLIIAIILILGLFIHPFITRRKDETIITIQSKLRENLKKSIKIINKCLFIYNLKL